MVNTSRRKFDYDSENDFILWGEIMNEIGKYGCDDYTIYKYEDIIMNMLYTNKTNAPDFENAKTNSECFIPILLEGIIINTGINEILVVHPKTREKYSNETLLHMRGCISQYYHINAKAKENNTYNIGTLQNIEPGTKVVIALANLFLKDSVSPKCIYADLIDIIPFSTEYYLDENCKLHGTDDYMIKYNEISERKLSVKSSDNNVKSEGCYIATVVYGSYDCPEVWTLRRYRDLKLYSSLIGTLFVRTYYAISPTLIKIFGKREWFKSIAKYQIDKIVENLQKKGYSSEKYFDKHN